MVDVTFAPDQDARDKALDIHTSFIIQAPAGSGKTELLSLRYLKLLSACEQPENVLAITFTRKAAAEMSRRIIGILNLTSQRLREGNLEFGSPHERQRFDIATRVLAQDQAQDWQLLANPARLRIQTIDSFCWQLGQQLPILSRLGGSPALSEDVAPSFDEAIRDTLAALNSDTAAGKDIAALLRHLDNDMAAAERLLKGLLEKREQWLPYILRINQDRQGELAYLQQSLALLVSETLEETLASLNPFLPEIQQLASFALFNLKHDLAGTDLCDLHEFDTPLQPAAGDLARWAFITGLLLTDKNTWRRQVTIRDGFPPGTKTDPEFAAQCKLMKKRMEELLQTLQSGPQLLQQLSDVRRLCGPPVDEPSWTFLTVVCRVLFQLAGHLRLAFQRARTIDYPEAGRAALAALGTAESPTDLALALDYRLLHILVDEFQDTSLLQRQLLEQLTAGWQPGDGKTLFLVGDPMQSVYQFRNANVGIFLQVQQEGLSNLALHRLVLSANFRSHATVVEWVNAVFAQAFPQRKNISRGAVVFERSVPASGAAAADGIRARVVSFAGEDRGAARIQEAREIINRINQLRTDFPGDSIAVLVRSRKHLGALLPLLREAGIGWQSSDIDSLTSLPVIEDLLCLTRAMVNRADRVAWLALLRAPWCGLVSSDLLAVASQPGSVWRAIQQPAAIPGLSADGQRRLQHIAFCLDYGERFYRRVPIRDLIETIWELLGGPSTVRETQELESVEAFFRLLGAEADYLLDDVSAFARKVTESFVPSPAMRIEQDALVQIMTMHKAKGLEFDHVILPGLAEQSKNDDKNLLLWHERFDRSGTQRLLLAVRSPAGAKESSFYELLRYESAYRARMESTRLLYIAVTRARRSALLLACLPRDDENQIKAPPESTLLGRLWQGLRGEFSPHIVELASTATLGPAQLWSHPTPLRRFSEPLQLPESMLARMRASSTAVNILPGQAADPLAALCGTLVHQSLQHIVDSGIGMPDPATLERSRRAWRLRLGRLSLSAAQISTAIADIELTLRTCLEDHRHNWIFDSRLRDSRCELAIGAKGASGVARHVVDRSFIDADGVRWIIDYKTSRPEPGTTVEQFLSQQTALHRDQLNRYRRLFQSLENRRVRTALFFTGLPALVELEPAPDTSTDSAV